MKKDKWKDNPDDLPRWKRLTPPQAQGGEGREGGEGAPAPADRHDPAAGERLQKILAQAGIASRRAAEEMIAGGRVTINGEVVREMGVRADPASDAIAVDGKPLKGVGEAGQAQKFVYIAVNKPVGVVSTVKDPEGRPTVLSLLVGARLAEQGLRVYPVGRLDTDSTGLLLLTNDGDLTFRLTHPRYGVDKEYRVVVRGRPGGEALTRLREGVMIEEGMTAPAKVDVLNHTEGNTTLLITIHEGRKRQVRLMCAAVGHQVIELTRVRFGTVELGDLQVGKWRNLALHEAHALRKSVKLKPVPSSQVAGVTQASEKETAKAAGRGRPVRRAQSPEGGQEEGASRRPSTGGGGGARRDAAPARRLLRGAPATGSGAFRVEREEREEREERRERGEHTGQGGRGPRPVAGRDRRPEGGRGAERGMETGAWAGTDRTAGRDGGTRPVTRTVTRTRTRPGAGPGSGPWGGGAGARPGARSGGGPRAGSGTGVGAGARQRGGFKPRGEAGTGEGARTRPRTRPGSGGPQGRPAGRRDDGPRGAGEAGGAPRRPGGARPARPARPGGGAKPQGSSRPPGGSGQAGGVRPPRGPRPGGRTGPSGGPRGAGGPRRGGPPGARNNDSKRRDR